MLEQGKMTQEWTSYLKRADPASGSIILFCFIAMFTTLESLNELMYKDMLEQGKMTQEWTNYLKREFCFVS